MGQKKMGMEEDVKTKLITTRRNFLCNAALASGVGVVTAHAALTRQGANEPAQRPNVLMICADQFRADFIGANHENPMVKTPNLDRLAARGVNFRQSKPGPAIRKGTRNEASCGERLYSPRRVRKVHPWSEKKTTIVLSS